MKSTMKIYLFIILTLFILPDKVSAHPVGDSGIITHLFSGLDHLVFIVAVFIVSTRIGRKAIGNVLAVIKKLFI
jgi:hypothetical protein